MEDQKQIKLLLIEDDPDDVFLMKKMISDAQYQDTKFIFEDRGSVQDALEFLKSNSVDLILSDLTLPDSRGLETFQKIHEAFPKLPVVVLSGMSDETLSLEAVRQGAQDYLVKGRVDKTLLIRTIVYALERQRIQKELDAKTKELEIANAQLEHLSLVDPLTELENRRGLQQILSREAMAAKRDGSELLAILVDLDDFKKVNDSLGHSMGDSVLKETATRLRRTLRGSDVISRIGGDEFIVLLPRTRRAEGVIVAEKLRAALCDEPITLPNSPIQVTASFGLVSVNVSEASIDELLVKAHAALKASKKLGKNRVSNDWDLDTNVENSPKSHEEFVRAIKCGNALRAVKQPIVSSKDRSIVGYEFLSRLDFEAAQLPDAFFRLSVENNILPFVDHQCFKKCIEASAQVQKGISKHINIFPSTIVNMPIEDLLGGLENLTNPEEYVLEISEKQIVGNPDALIKALGQYKKKGFRIAVDDIGFGNSSLESLLLLEPHIVKIDRIWIHDIAKGEGQYRTVTRLMRVLEAIDAQVVAEGVENEEDFKTVCELGIPYSQGFLFGKPE